jgi:hypothetical protein
MQLSAAIPFFPVERSVVAALLPDASPAHHHAVVGHVKRALASMPEHLRLGVAAESVLLTVIVRLRKHPVDDVEAVRTELELWQENRIGVIRQYVRMFTSLVMFADLELADDIVLDLENDTIS